MQLSGALEAFRVQDVLGLVGRKPGQWKITLDGVPAVTARSSGCATGRW